MVLGRRVFWEDGTLCVVEGKGVREEIMGFLCRRSWVFGFLILVWRWSFRRLWLSGSCVFR